MTNSEFINELEKLGVKLDDDKLDKLEKYYQMLVDANNKFNLTAITDKKDVYLKHFYDSILASLVFDSDNFNLCDMGTGAGFPGIVLKIVFPKIRLTLVDATKKKTEFLKEVVSTLELDDVSIYNDRIENFAYLHEKEFDIVIARAVARLNILLELASRMIKVNGYFVAMKGSLEEEIDEATNALKVLHMEIVETKDLVLPIENSKRKIIKIKKNDDTPKMYPRNFAKITKIPL
jgi:16S rRNA (guanine527-N7)-methyltransferase